MEALVSITLKTFQRYITWIPRRFIFETAVLRAIVHKFLPIEVFQCDTIQCLTEALSLYKDTSDAPPQHQAMITEVFVSVLQWFAGQYPNSHLNPPSPSSIIPGSKKQVLLKHFALFVTLFFKRYTDLIDCRLCADAQGKQANSRASNASLQNSLLVNKSSMDQQSTASSVLANAVSSSSSGGSGGAGTKYPLVDLNLVQVMTFDPTTGRFDPSKGLSRLSLNHLYQCFTIAQRALTWICQTEDEGTTFKICLDYWYILSMQLYLSECNTVLKNSIIAASESKYPAFGGGQSGGGGGDTSTLMAGMSVSNHDMSFTLARSRKELYADLCVTLREIMVAHMVKPEEVLVVEDSEGNVIRETIKDTAGLAQYVTMRETLVFLTHLDSQDTKNIMLNKLSRQVSGEEWSFHNLNTLCWAIGSISGAMTEGDEKHFLVHVIKDLLGLCEKKKGKKNKAIVASNIMYVVGQYPRFLDQHWKFLKTVVNKLFEFMHEFHEGVRDMACETFLKISKKCRANFVKNHVNEEKPFVVVLFAGLRKTISDLEPHQMQVYFEAVGHMVAAENNPKLQEQYLADLMQLPNNTWTDVMRNAQTNASTLADIKTGNTLIKILKTNVRVSNSLKAPYISQIARIFLEMLNVYKWYSDYISNECQSSNHFTIDQAKQNFDFTPTLSIESQKMRSVKVEILSLMDHFFRDVREAGNGGRDGINTTSGLSGGSPSNSNSHSGSTFGASPAYGSSSGKGGGVKAMPMPNQAVANQQTSVINLIIRNFIPPLFDQILAGYTSAPIPQAREPEVLRLFTSIIELLREKITHRVPDIIYHLFECTLEMLTRNFTDFPDHRRYFFLFLRAVNKYCFNALFNIPPRTQSLVVQSIVWGIKHHDRIIAEISLNLLAELLRNVGATASVAQGFYKTHLVALLEETLKVLTDGMHKSCFPMHCSVLRSIISLVEKGGVTEPLFVQEQFPSIHTNQAYLRLFTQKHISEHFPNLGKSDLNNYINLLFNMNRTMNDFKCTLRDFLVQIKEFAKQGDDTAALYEMEAQERKQRDLQEQQKIKKQVPGLLNPYSDEIDDDDL